MPKISTSIALALYEEDCQTMVALSTPEQDPHWHDWYEYGLFLFNEKNEENEEFEKDEDIVETEQTATHTKISNSRRRNRRISDIKAKKKLKRNAQIAISSYSKRSEDIMHFTSKVKDETKILKHNHPLIRAERLIKRAKKFN